MSLFKKVYRKDLFRYQYQLSLYMRIWHFLFRKCQYANNKFSKSIYRVLFRIHSNRRGLEISSRQEIGSGLYIGHAYNITINPKVKIGKNCNLHKGIVIGQTNRGKCKGTPIIGDNVWIGINAAVVGGITIGDDVLIAPNSYVNCDVPSHSVVVGNPCVIKHRDNATEGYVNNVIE